MMICFSGSSSASLSGRRPWAEWLWDRDGKTGVLGDRPGVSPTARTPEVIVDPWQSATPRWITLSISRTLPGQSYRPSISSASGEKPVTGLANSMANRSRKMLGKQRDVLAPKPERGKLEADVVDPLVKLAAELALLDQGRKVLAGREHESERPPRLGPVSRAARTRRW